MESINKLAKRLLHELERDGHITKVVSDRIHDKLVEYLCVSWQKGAGSILHFLERIEDRLKKDAATNDVGITK